LGGKIGFTLVLHTWDQKLRGHFHVHGLIASGALAQDGSTWIAGGSEFLFPVHGLSKVFRAKYLDGLARLLESNALDIPPQLSQLQQPDSRAHWLERCRNKPWVVYSKAPFTGPHKLLNYLGRYTHRVAISNDRLLRCDNGRVVYRYRDRRDGDRLKTDTLPAERFIRRFLQHVLPDHFLRIRHYGLWANRVKQKHLTRCRELLGVRLPRTKTNRPPSAAEWLSSVVGIDISRCPCCGEPLRRATLPPSRLFAHPAPSLPRLSYSPAWDTS
jgi:hypothetical protein